MTKHHPDDPKWVIGMVFCDHVLARNPLVASEKRDLKMYKNWNTTSIPMIQFWIIGIDVKLNDENRIAHFGLSGSERGDLYAIKP